MKCRRCKTSFDYDACYGICPKCAAYNRPDGKDEMKTVMGEDAGSFEEEYHPPVMSTGEAGDFLGMDEPAAHRRSKNKNNGKQKEFQQRLSNPYVETTVKAGKTVPYCDHDKKTTKKEKKKKKSKAGGILALLFCVAIGVCSEYSTEIEQFCMKIYGDYFAEKGSLSGLKHTDEITYTEKKTVGGRMLTFGSAYELYTDDEEFLVIPYRQIVESLPETTQEIAREYDLKCYVANNGLYLDAVPAYVMEDTYGVEGIGTVNNAYSDEDKSLIFVGDFSGERENGTVQLNLSFRKDGADLPVIYEVTLPLEDEEAASETAVSAEAVWKKKELDETATESSYATPVIERIGNQYRGEEAESGSVFYQITQDFVNNDRDYLQASDMELYLTDLSSTRSTYDFGGITTLSERFDSDDPLSLYRLLILPWKEKGTKITVFEVAENCDRIGAELYFMGETKEWQASL